MLKAFALLARMKRLRGTRLDPFGRTAERRLERRLIEDYFARIDEVLATMTQDNHHLAVEIARVPELIRGFGHVKAEHLATARAREDELLRAYRGPAAPTLAAAE